MKQPLVLFSLRFPKKKKDHCIQSPTSGHPRSTLYDHRRAWPSALQPLATPASIPFWLDFSYSALHCWASDYPRRSFVSLQQALWPLATSIASLMTIFIDCLTLICIFRTVRFCLQYLVLIGYSLVAVFHCLGLFFAGLAQFSLMGTNPHSWRLFCVGWNHSDLLVYLFSSPVGFELSGLALFLVFW